MITARRAWSLRSTEEPGRSPPSRQRCAQGRTGRHLAALGGAAPGRTGTRATTQRLATLPATATKHGPGQRAGPRSAHTLTHPHAHTLVYMLTHTYTLTPALKLHPRAHTITPTHTRMLAHIHTHPHIHNYSHTHMHTHSRPRLWMCTGSRRLPATRPPGTAPTAGRGGPLTPQAALRAAPPRPQQVSAQPPAHQAWPLRESQPSLATGRGREGTRWLHSRRDPPGSTEGTAAQKTARPVLRTTRG